MGWVKALKSPGHITEAIIHFNKAREGLEKSFSNVDVSRSLFDALNKIQTEWGVHEGDQEIGEIKAFQTMILKGLETEDKIKFLQSEEIKDLVSFQPQIMNHYTLRMHRYRPGREIDPELAKKASREHHRAVNAYGRCLSEKNDVARESMIKRLAELLYIIRSNIAHGEKTPYGPDLDKKERDNKVCEVAIPLQILLVNALLDYPDQKLIVYGTLAPEDVNRNILSDLQGSWENCSVHGCIEKINGLSFFVWQPNEPTIDLRLFTSAILPKSWLQLDQFEGSDYRRILVPIVKSDKMVVANIYAAGRNPSKL